MKAVFISYNQALTERIDMILSYLHIRGFTKWETLHGRGSVNGEPHFGSHTWPSLNSAILTIIEDEKVPSLLEALKKLNEKTEEQGTRAFVWSIEGGM